ncbi:MAG TPA: alkaline phosphatase family protein [Dehalococcoidia bacterium]|nr:alkaline phosphatase family protein [Dehalococcoidia bacterium]
MTTVEERIAGPERPGGQGLDANQEQSGNRAIVALLTDPVRGEQVDLVMTYRRERRDDDAPEGAGRRNAGASGQASDGAYEVWAKRGMVRFVRFLEPAGGYGYRVIEQVGENPIADQDPTRLSTKAEELEAAKKSGHSGNDQAKAFIEPEQVSYPLAYERIAQLFDSPNAPDMAISPKSYAFGRQPGQHGALDVVQSRAPLVFSGPGVIEGETDVICSHVDVTPTLAKLLGLPLIDGMDSSGRTSSERRVAPDVYLKRQDGRVLDEILENEPANQQVSKPERAYIFLLDGLSNTELKERLEHDRESIPNLARIIERGVMFRYGVFATFPTITWPSHNALGTGAWCGHHDIVNPTYYLRESRQVVTPQGSIWDTEKYLADGVETLYEAIHREHGKWDPSTGKGVVTASLNEPCGRGALHATLERRLLMDGERLRDVAKENRGDTNPRWKEEEQEHVYRFSGTDIQGLAQSLLLFDSATQPPPVFTFHENSLTDAVGHDYGPHHEAMRDALVETDKRIGKILSVLDRRGLFESTLFVISADHGMAQTNVALAADPAQAVVDAGLKAVVTSPLIYLIDMEVTVEHSADGRTLNVTVVENDANAHGEKPAVEAAGVEVIAPHGKVLAQARTDGFGVAGLPLPVGEDPESLIVRVEHERFNTRHLRLDGTNVVEDVRERLYGG